MKSGTHRFKQTVVARALMTAFCGGIVVAGAIAPTAYAQTNATGTIYGQAAPGAQVVITSKESGARRTVTPDAAGRFSVGSMATGLYRVEQVVGGKVTATTDNVEVRIGSGTEVAFATGNTLQTVQVTGAAQKIDVTAIGSTTSFSATDLARVPVGTNVGAIIQLAPNTTISDARYGGANAPVFGGSSASENAYYINGFPVTTLLTQVGFSQLPFNSIAQAQILTGGYGAEFGRSTGGVVNIVTKRGTNDWVAGLAYSINPNIWRARQRDQFFEPNTGPLANKLQFYNGLNTDTQTSKSFYFGGPVIKDKLFVFAAGELIERDVNGIRTANASVNGSVSTSSFQERHVETPRGLIKLDWQINDAHHLEFTHIADKTYDSRRFYGFSYATLQRTYVNNGGQDYVNWGTTAVTASNGADLDILKYTGYLTDDLTFTAVVGRTKSPHIQSPVGYNPAIPQVTSNASNQIPAFAPYGTGNPITGNINVPGAFDQNTGYRLDLEYRLNKQHNLRFGIDQNTIKSKAGQQTAGGFIWAYGKTSPGSPVDGIGSAPNSVAGNPYAQQGYYVQQVFSDTKSTPTVDQNAIYIEDRWQVNDRLLLSLGLRNEGFNNKNGDGQSYIKLNKQLAPRLGASWDVLGDSSTKVFGSIGRYHVPLPTNVAVRAAGSSLNAQQNFVYTGVNPDGTPTGLTPISNLYSLNNELGQARDPKTVADTTIKGNFQDEMQIGFEKAISKSLNVGAKITHRALKTALDDFCDDRPFRVWAARNGITVSDDWAGPPYGGFACALFNPGRSAVFYQDLNADGKLERVELSAADLGFAKPKRTYDALDLFAEHPFDGKWWGKVTYTLSRNKGNTEGQLLSDIGQGDVATTQNFDFPEFSNYANGLLPNDRKHQLKMFGYYQLTPEWGFGANWLWASGRPLNCLGNNPGYPHATDPQTFGGGTGYGPAYFYCNGGIPSPRGSLGRLPPDNRVDVSVTYKPQWLTGLSMKLEMFNVFNRQQAQVVEERSVPRGATTVRQTYQSVQAYAAPRSGKFTIAYDHKF